MKLPVRWQPLALAFAISMAIASLGSSFTELGPWYQGLRQPSWKPPDIAFGIIWSIIFSNAAFSGAIAWSAAKSPRNKGWVLALFFGNALLNVTWSWLYFAQRRPDWALLEWCFLWVSVLLLVVGLWRLSRFAALLNLPYLLWVSIAGLLNRATVELNGPFG